MSEKSLALRATAALAVGVLALHQLRYLAGFGDDAGRALDAHTHGYLTLITPLVALLAALAAGQFVAAVARAGRDGNDRGARVGRFAPLWLASATALFGAYAGQELVEGALSAGHPGGLAAVAGDGGLWAAPLALAIGLLVALLLRGADAALVYAAGRVRRVASRRPVKRAPRASVVVDLPPLTVIGCNLAGRAPPLVSC